MFRGYFCIICFLLLLFLNVGCDKNEPQKPDDGSVENPISNPDFSINFYSSEVFPNTANSPQLTIKDSGFQVTSFGASTGNLLGPIERLYISDVNSQSEWVGILNDFGRMEFLYEINSSTKELLPTLYWYEAVSNNEYIIRKYDYDWSSRLGTLLYEANVRGDVIDVIFENTISSKSKESAKKIKKSNKAYTAPIPNLHRLLTISRYENMKSMGTKKIDLFDEFDEKLDEIVAVLQNAKKNLFDAPCKVSTLLSKPDKSLVCRLSNQLNRITDEKLFDDFNSISGEVSQNQFDYNGDSYDLSFEFFENINDVLGDIKNHLNDVRSNFSNSMSFDFDDFSSEFENFYSVENEDLNDLSNSNGVLQIGLIWNNTVDMDLHVTDINGEIIYWENPNSASGGFLDRDDIDGIGPENIYWANGIPNGSYAVDLVYFGPEDGPFTDCTVTISNGLGIYQTFQVSMGYFDQRRVRVIEFVSQNGILNFN